MNILLAAAENSALRGAKAGGLGDVVGGTGPELAAQGCSVTTIIPSYGFVHRQNESKYFASVNFVFRGYDHLADFYEVTGKNRDNIVRHLIVDHPLLGTGGTNQIYSHDPSDRPFATDAARFALFCAAVASAIVQNQIRRPDCVHLHDWHTAFFLILRKFHPDFKSLKTIRTVYTIHNIALQGIRPFWGSDSSLTAWFPGLGYDPIDISDPRWPDCVNPMAAGIRMADAVHTVSPTYAEEILKPGRKPDFYPGGEGLETDLQRAGKENRLFGILNGCTYPEDRKSLKSDFQTLTETLKSAIPGWLGGEKNLPTSHFLSYIRLIENAHRADGTSILVTSVSRLTDQKVLLMKERGSTGKPGLVEILHLLEHHNGLYILLGTGDPAYERFFIEMSARFGCFIFLNGYSDKCADALFANGDLFLMPSSFEPCGISQMLAMRDGQPCVVHHVGGLKDTVKHLYNGFAFTGATVAQQVDDFVSTTRDALLMRENDPGQWEKIRSQAAGERFSWEKSAALYIEKLYAGDGDRKS